MKLTRRLLLIPSLSFVCCSLLIPAPPPVNAVTVDCNTVSQVCRDMGDMVYDMCIVSGGTPSDCTWSSALYVIRCMRNNGCEPVNN